MAGLPLTVENIEKTLKELNRRLQHVISTTKKFSAADRNALALKAHGYSYKLSNARQAEIVEYAIPSPSWNELESTLRTDIRLFSMQLTVKRASANTRV